MRLAKLMGLFLFIVLFSCTGKIRPKGEIENKTHPIKPFSHLKLNGKFNVFYIKSNQNFIDVETYSNIDENLNIINKGDTLLISEKQPVEKVDFYRLNLYTSSKIQHIKISDSAQMNATSNLKSKSLDFNLEHYGKFIGGIDAEETKINMSHLSLMNAKGKSENVYLRMKDTANFLSPYFKISKADLKSINQSYTEINVIDTINADVQNTSKVLYYNNPVRDFKIGDSAIVNHQKLN